MSRSSTNMSTEHDGNHVFGLLTQLSEMLVKKNSFTISDKSQTRMIKKARSSMYETLLGKKHVKEIDRMSKDIDHMSPVSWLIAQRSILNNTGRNELASELDDAIREAFSLNWHNSPIPILRMLICLTDSCSDTVTKEIPEYEPFSLSKKLNLFEGRSEQTTRVYPIISSDIFKPPPWMNMKHSVSPFGGYNTSFPFTKEPGEGLSLFEKFSNMPSKSRKSASSSVYQIKPITPLTGPRDLTSPLSMSRSILEDEGYVTPMTDVVNSSHIPSKDDYKDPTQLWSDALEITLPQLKTWETLGNLVTHAEPPFISAASSEAIHHLFGLTNMYCNVFNTQHSWDPKPITREEFTRDIFLLLTGIKSINFPFIVENDSFVVRKGMWLEGYCVDDTSELCQDFLFCGSHFRRLEKFSHSSVINEKDGGLMIQALKDCVKRWILFYHGTVLILSARFKSMRNSILIYKLLEHGRALKQQVYCVSQLCHVCGPTQNTSLPNGVALLALLYREASLSNYHQSSILHSALKSCCEVYLKCLQRWIFLGDCSENEDNEFFVRRDPCFCNKRDRAFWTRGFVLEKSAVPEFLSGLEGAVFECGRAMNLLKLCSSQHPLCLLLEKRHPSVYCCLYKSDMERVLEECAQFETEAKKISGNFMNVSRILELENEEAVHLHELVHKAQKERAIAHAATKIQQEKERAEKRAKQNADLKAQILATQQRKAEEKEQKRIEDELYLLECKRLKEVAKLVEEEERQKMIAHYEELGKIIDKQNMLKEWQLKRLKISDKRQAFLYEDGINLARDFQLMDKSTMAFQNSESLKVVADLGSDHDTQETLLSDIIDSITPYETSIPKNNEDTLVLEQKSQIKKNQDVLDLHQDASFIKAKVLQIDYGIVSDNVIDIGSNGNTAIRDDLHSKKGDESNADHSASYLQENNLVENEKIDYTETNEEIQPRDKDKATKECNLDILNSDLIRNRRKVMSEDDSWKSTASVYVEKEISESRETITTNSCISSDRSLERERNRQKVLDSEFNTITGVRRFDSKSETQSLQQKQVPRAMSDLEKNRKKVLGEEYNVLTGELSSQKHTVSPYLVVTKSDSGIEVFSSEVGETESTSCFEMKQRATTQSSDSSSKAVTLERPQLLSINSESSVLTSPLTTPHSMPDMPVFTSPFKGTNHLPNELPLSSPLLNSSSGQFGFKVQGIPLMVDIADNFAMRLQSRFENLSVERESTPDFAEPPRIFDNTSWLESSLQKCLLLPLRVQHRYVSAALLNYFLVDLKLLSHFRSLRSYYFMQDGEFGRHLTVKMFTQMYKVSTPDDLFNQRSLDTVIQEALASSQGSADPNNERLSLAVNFVPHHFSHFSPNVFDCLQLSYKIQWPLNLLLTPDALEKYNLIFVFLIRLKRVAWLLQEDFVALKNTARGCFKEQHRDLLNSPQYHQVQIIRHSMSQFVQATLNYVSSCVLHASWTDFASSLKYATTIDHIYNAHIEYIKRLLKRCLLNNNSKRVEAVLTKILIIIIKFHGNLRVRPWQVPSKQPSPGSQSVYLEHPNFLNLLACDTHFKLQISKLISYLERLISPPNQQEHLAEYLLLLNINGFYKSSDYLKHAENIQPESDGKSVTISRSVSRDLLSVSQQLPC